MTGFVVMLEKVCVHVTGFADFNCQNNDDEFVHEHFLYCCDCSHSWGSGLIRMCYFKEAYC